MWWIIYFLLGAAIIASPLQFDYEEDEIKWYTWKDWVGYAVIFLLWPVALLASWFNLTRQR